jgi:hypothetical protein
MFHSEMRSMNTPFYVWLVEVEEALWRMIRGVFRFVSEWLPTWLFHVIVKGIWPVCVRLTRVVFVACIWLGIMFTPLTIGFACKLPWWWRFGSTAWLGAAIVGSMWGLTRLAKKRKANLA